MTPIKGWYPRCHQRLIPTPICSMYGIFTYMYHQFKPNVGKYSIHVASGMYQIGPPFCCHQVPILFVGARFVGDPKGFQQLEKIPQLPNSCPTWGGPQKVSLKETIKNTHAGQFFVTFLGWLSDHFKGLSDLQVGNQKVTLNHLVFWELLMNPLFKTQPQPASQCTWSHVSQPWDTGIFLPHIQPTPASQVYQPQTTHSWWLNLIDPLFSPPKWEKNADLFVHVVDLILWNLTLCSPTGSPLHGRLEKRSHEWQRCISYWFKGFSSLSCQFWTGSLRLYVEFSFEKCHGRTHLNPPGISVPFFTSQSSVDLFLSASRKSPHLWFWG